MNHEAASEVVPGEAEEATEATGATAEEGEAEEEAVHGAVAEA